MTELEDLRRLRYFVAVAESASFTRAAEKLHVSQPAVSEAVRQLERAIGVELLGRGDRPISLTRAGEALLQDARPLLAGARRATARARRIAAGDEGDIVIASTLSLSAGFVPALTSRLALRSPAPRLLHRLAWTPDVVEAVESGDATIGFARYAPPVPGLSQETLGHEPVVACMSAGHSMATSSTMSLQALADERWAVMDRTVGPRWYDVFVASCAAAGFAPEIVELVAAADLTAAQATFRRVAAGELVTYVGMSLVPAITHFGIACVPFDATLAPLPVDALWRGEDLLAESVLDAARLVCADAWWLPEAGT